MTFKILLSLLAIVATSACGHDSPSERDAAAVRPGGGQQQTPPDDGSGQRPGVDDANSMKRELADDVWRVVGPETSLRYDRGGVMFTTRSDGSVEVVDLDGADSVCINIGKEGVDSVMAGASVVVNDRPVELRQMKLLKHGDGRSWYVAKDVSDRQWVIVLP